MLDRGMAGFFSSATLEQIRAASDIVDVIGSYLPLKRAGANFVALCPFHKEKTPSFNVNPHRQIFHCFGCHKGGDVFTFVKEYENIDFVDAVRRLADRAKIPLEFDQNPGEQQSRHLKDQLAANPRADRPALAKLPAQRGRRPDRPRLPGQTRRVAGGRETVPPRRRAGRVGRHRQLGEEQRPRTRAGRKGGPHYSEAEGGSQESESGKSDLRPPTSDFRRYYDRFRGRLMFPICDEQGRVIGFSGRVLSGDEKTAKYVNSPETPIFTKSKVFFGLDKSKRAILDAGFAIVCEGQLDVISCHSKGVTHVVAPQGTALTAQHVQILRRYTNDIILCFDGDNAGRKAAARGFDELVTLKIPFRVAEIPPPEDPDSFLKKFGFKAFFDLLIEARDFFDWYLDYLSNLNDIKSDRGKIAVVHGMAELLKHPENMVLIDTYAQKTALRLGVSPEAVRAEFAKVQSSKFKLQGPGSDVSTLNVEPGTLNRPSPQEFWLLKLLLLHDELAAWAALHLDVNWIGHPVTRQIVAQRLAAQTNESWKNVAALLDECETPEMRSLVTEAVAEDRKIPNPQQQITDVALRLRNQFLDRQIAALTHKVSQPETSEADRMVLLRQQQEFRQQKRVPLK